LLFGEVLRAIAAAANLAHGDCSLAPWTEFEDIAPQEAKNYEAQSTMLLKIVGSQQTSAIFIGDI
jgi:hypothetical protein